MPVTVQKGTARPRSTLLTTAEASTDLSATQADLKARLATQLILGANIPCKNCGWVRRASIKAMRGSC